MCRLLGVSFGKEREDLDAGEIAAILFPALVGQGPHAYGWMSYDEASGVITHEKFEGRCDTIEAYDNIIELVDPDAKWLVGHTRWATHGSPKNPLNNHPILHRDIIGVHNGVLWNHEDILKRTGRENDGTEVDSEAIFAAVNRWGPSEGLRKVKGDMVTIYANRARPHVLHLARSHGRQLTLAWSKKGNLFFASDASALDKLRPEIEFVNQSVISENRLLLVRNGKIIQRHRFAPVEPPKRFEFTSPRQPLPTQDRLGPSELAAIQRLHSAQDRVNVARAQKRGDLLFPKKQQGIPVPPKGTPAKKVDYSKPPVMGKKQRKRARRGQKAKNLVFVGGQWIDRDLWEAMKRDEAAREVAREDDEPFDPGVAYGD